MAVAMTHRAVVIAWEALRERPSPALINANPATVKGVRTRNTRQSPNVRSCAEGSITLFHRRGKMSTEHQHEPQDLDCETRIDKRSDHVAVQECESCDYDAPSRQQQQKSTKFHDFGLSIAEVRRLCCNHNTTPELWQHSYFRLEESK